jgi:lipopolysaccharide transport system ATP-binding protein
MSDFAIRAEHLGKRYRIGIGRRSGRKNVLTTVAGQLSYLSSTLREPDPDEIIWAVRDVSLEVKAGEVVGLIGANGAGKSTLLKMLSRITKPTQGKAWLNGRVGSLLEVGTGFHDELTGRENVYLSGTILGMRRAEIAQKFDEIVAFSGVEKFIDTPIKRYSSGMKVRLGFAVAAHLEPEILLVDEVLAVGDGAFQKKCLGKMSDVAKDGRTILFVSHNMVAVQSLCERSILLSDGLVAEDGPTARVVPLYLARFSTTQTERTWDDPAAAPGGDGMRLHYIGVKPAGGESTEAITTQTPLIIETAYWNLAPGTQLHIVFHVYNEQGIIAFSTVSLETDQTQRGPLPAGLIRSFCHIPGDFLNSGTHRITMMMFENAARRVLRMDDALAFEVLDLESRAGGWYGREPGAVHPKLRWETVLPESTLVMAGSP